MKLWWLNNFIRLGAEKAAVEQLAANENWFTLNDWQINEYRFAADGFITAHGIDYDIYLIYPDQFPSVPAWVEPKNRDVRWSSHQYGKGGSLCLELRPDNWSASASGADVLRSAFNLLFAENPLGEGDRGEVTSAHQIGEIQSYEWGQNPVLISAGCLERLRTGEAEDIRALRWSVEDNIWPIMIFDAIDCERSQHPLSFDLGTLRHELPVVIGRMELSATTPADRVTLATALGVKLDPVLHRDALVAVSVSGEDIIPFHSPDPESVYTRKWVVLPEQAGLRSGRQDAAFGKTVAVVGLGSVGSKVAEILLRSGVHNFVLIDGDVLLPANLERHILDWRDVGFRKVHAVKRHLLHIVPGATINVIATNLNWQRSAETCADQINLLATCDLIFDATGDVPSALMLGALAAVNKKPFVSAEVFEGGLGCLIARSLPGRDPIYDSGRAAYSAFCEKENVAPPLAGSKTYESLTEAGEPIVADDAAVTIAAAHAARVILDILDDKVGDTDTAWFLMGFKKGWLFNCHGCTISLNIGRASANIEAIEDDVEARKFALALAEEVVNAVKASK
jgi:sulfur-carrier protein adenylyltransferase/sulfurtransferase